MKIEVNSRDRVSGVPEDYVFEMKQAIKDIRGFSLIGAYVPNTMYRIVTGYNDTFKFTYTPSTGGGAQTTTSYIGTITGNRDYTIAELTAAIQTEIQTKIGGTEVTVTYDEDTNKLSFLCTDADILSGVFSLLSSARQMWPDVIPVDGSDSLIGFSIAGIARLGAWMLGVKQTDPNTILLSGDDVIVLGDELTPTPMPNQLNMQYPMNRLHLAVGEAAGPTGTGIRTAHGDATYVVPLTVNHAEFQEWYAADTFTQTVTIADDGVAKIRVNWRPVDPALDAAFSFGGVDHTLLIDVVEY
jgi:hypothetical protein